jgi:hypothetical protein
MLVMAAIAAFSGSNPIALIYQLDSQLDAATRSAVGEIGPGG